MEGVQARTNGTIRSYRDLEVRQRSMRMLRPIHDLALKLPEFERYALADQLRRAARSVPANIAEGYAKKRYVKNFRSFLVHAMGSASEVVVHLEMATEVGYAPRDEAAAIIEEYEIIGRQLNRLIQAWRDFSDTPTTNFKQRDDQ